MNRRELARNLCRRPDGLEKSDEEWEPNWRWYGVVRLSDWTRYRGAKRLLTRWWEKTQTENPYLYLFAVIECSRRPLRTSIFMLIGDVGSKERCIDWWKSQGAKSVSLFNYKPGAFCPFVIDKSDDYGTFETVIDFHDGLYWSDEP